MKFACVLLCFLVTCSLAHRELDLVIKRADSLIQARPGDPALYLDRGELHRLHRDWDRALRDYGIVDSLKPGWNAVRYCRARLYYDRGEDSLALAFLDSLLSLEGNHTEGLLLRGDVWLRFGKAKNAREDFEAALEKIQRPTPALYHQLVTAALAIGDTSAALQWLDQGVEQLGNIDLLQGTGVRIETAGGHYEKALARLEVQYQRRNNRVRYYFSRGKIYEKKGKPATAVENYRSALEALGSIPKRVSGSEAYIALRDSIETALKKNQ